MWISSYKVMVCVDINITSHKGSPQTYHSTHMVSHRSTYHVMECVDINASSYRGAPHTYHSKHIVLIPC
eukprot:c31552_g1_i1 orf=169-375(+)